MERVHAEENRVLSKHGPFSSTYVHASAIVGSQQHKDNIEEMARRIQDCICSGSFGGEPLHCYRGIKTDDFIFDDEIQTTKFLSLTEDAKCEFAPAVYKVKQGQLLTDIHYMWEVPLYFEGSYLQDHQLIYNELVEVRTSWHGKYTAVFYSPSDITCNRFELQPLATRLY